MEHDAKRGLKFLRFSLDDHLMPGSQALKLSVFLGEKLAVSNRHSRRMYIHNHVLEGTEHGQGVLLHPDLLTAII